MKVELCEFLLHSNAFAVCVEKLELFFHMLNRSKDELLIWW